MPAQVHFSIPHCCAGWDLRTSVVVDAADCEMPDVQRAARIPRLDFRSHSALAVIGACTLNAIRAVAPARSATFHMHWKILRYEKSMSKESLEFFWPPESAAGARAPVSVCVTDDSQEILLLYVSAAAPVHTFATAPVSVRPVRATARTRLHPTQIAVSVLGGNIVRYCVTAAIVRHSTSVLVDVIAALPPRSIVQRS